MGNGTGVSVGVIVKVVVAVAEDEEVVGMNSPVAVASVDLPGVSAKGVNLIPRVEGGVVVLADVGVKVAMLNPVDTEPAMDVGASVGSKFDSGAIAITCS